MIISKKEDIVIYTATVMATDTAMARMAPMAADITKILKNLRCGIRSRNLLKENKILSAVSIQHSAVSIQQSAFSIQRSAFSGQHSAFSLQHSAVIQNSKFKIQNKSINH